MAPFKKYIAEGVGTMFLVLLACGSADCLIKLHCNSRLQYGFIYVRVLHRNVEKFARFISVFYYFFANFVS